MTNQIKIPKGEEIAFSLAALAILVVPFTIATQALAGNRTMGVFNASDNPAEIECGNGSREELPPQLGTNCGDGAFPNQFIKINGDIYRYEYDENLSNHFRIENKGVTRGN